MTISSHALGAPLAAAQRGGDVRLHDLAQGRDVRGPHVFAAPDDAVIVNGAIRATVGPSGAVPSLDLDAWRGPVTVSDAISDTLADTLAGAAATPAWHSVGSVLIDSPDVSSGISAVRVVSVSPERVTVRLDVASLGDVFVSLLRGEPMLRIQHGRAKAPAVSVGRRVSWSAGSFSAAGSRIEETWSPAEDSMFRFIGGFETMNADAGARTLATPAAASTARYCVGVADGRWWSTPRDLHHQMAGVTERWTAVTS